MKSDLIYYFHVVRQWAGQFGRNVVALVRANVRGWYQIGSELVRWVAGTITIAQAGYLVSCLFVLIVPVLPWISFPLDLAAPEVIGLSPNHKLLFFAPALLGLVFFLFDVPRRRAVHVGVSVVILAVYAAGFIFPHFVFVPLIRREDYSFTPWVFLYAPAVLLMLASGAVALRSSLIDIPAIRTILSRMD